MTDTTLTISPPSSKTALNEALDDVVNAAIANGVDITGGYQVQGDGTDYRYGVEVYRVAREGGD